MTTALDPRGLRIVKATVRDGEDTWHIECRLSDGQKGAFIRVDKEFEGLAEEIADFLNNAAPQGTGTERTAVAPPPAPVGAAPDGTAPQELPAVTSARRQASDGGCYPETGKPGPSSSPIRDSAKQPAEAVPPHPDLPGLLKAVEMCKKNSVVYWLERELRAEIARLEEGE